jgi:hypothetical protein
MLIHIPSKWIQAATAPTFAISTPEGRYYIYIRGGSPLNRFEEYILPTSSASCRGSLEGT